MMRLRYVGDPPPPVGALPLPEGWPAADHDELNEDLVEAKVASGLYEAPKAPRVARATTDREEA